MCLCDFHIHKTNILGRLPRTLSADELAQLGQLGLQVLVAVLERLDPLAVLEILRHQYVDPALQLVHVLLLLPSAFLGGDLRRLEELAINFCEL